MVSNKKGHRRSYFVHAPHMCAVFGKRRSVNVDGQSVAVTQQHKHTLPMPATPRRPPTKRQCCIPSPTAGTAVTASSCASAVTAVTGYTEFTRFTARTTATAGTAVSNMVTSAIPDMTVAEVRQALQTLRKRQDAASAEEPLFGCDPITDTRTVAKFCADYTYGQALKRHLKSSRPGGVGFAASAALEAAGAAAVARQGVPGPKGGPNDPFPFTLGWQPQTERGRQAFLASQHGAEWVLGTRQTAKSPDVVGDPASAGVGVAAAAAVVGVTIAAAVAATGVDAVDSVHRGSGGTTLEVPVMLPPPTQPDEDVLQDLNDAKVPPPRVMTRARANKR